MSTWEVRKAMREYGKEKGKMSTWEVRKAMRENGKEKGKRCQKRD